MNEEFQYAYDLRNNTFVPRVYATLTCPKCTGSGWRQVAVDDVRKCWKCNGTGYIHKWIEPEDMWKRMGRRG